MKGGTKNEYPTVEKLCFKKYVLEFYDVGLLQSIQYPHLGVSPDGIILIQRGEQKHYATLEIKSSFGDESRWKKQQKNLEKRLSVCMVMTHLKMC